VVLAAASKMFDALMQFILIFRVRVIIKTYYPRIVGQLFEIVRIESTLLIIMPMVVN